MTNVRLEESSVSTADREFGSLKSKVVSRPIKAIMDSVLPSPMGSAMMPP
jgi:hypothetical protein